MSKQFQGIQNFRDMGSVTTKDGRTVKQGLLFRSGHLANATADDIKMLQEAGVQLVFDFRDEEEATRYPSPQLANVVMERIPAITGNSAVKTGDLQQALQSGALDNLVNSLSQFYTSMIFSNPSYKALLTHFVNGKAPILQHCTAGKDRTGIGAALMYLILGVSEATIIEEFLLTNKANSEKVPQWYEVVVKMVGDLPQLKMLLGVSAEQMQAVFTAIQDKYGSYEAYFEQEYGITAADIERARAHYLI